MSSLKMKCCSMCGQVMESLPAGHKLVYRRTFTLPEDWAGDRLRINFQAVDYTAEVRAHQLTACFSSIMFNTGFHKRAAIRPAHRWL